MERNDSLNDIVTCNINIAQPPAEQEAYNSILLVVATHDGTPTVTTVPDVIEISEANDLVKYGYTTAHAAYKAATVAFSQNPCPKKLYVIERKTTDEDEDEETPDTYETLALTLARAKSTSSNWYGIYMVGFRTSADLLACSNYAETNEYLTAFEYQDIDNFPLSQTEFYRTFCIMSVDQVNETSCDENTYAALAWMSKCFGYAPGSETWALKTLYNTVPASLTDSQKTALNDANITFYSRYASKNITSNKGGKVLAGEWIDVIRFRDYLKNEIQSKAFKVLTDNPKLPFTGAGITAIEGAAESALIEGQQSGGIATVDYDAEGNEIPGYTLTVPNMSDISLSDKQNRVLNGVSFTAKLTGAIHCANIKGTLSF